jgi:hypothetical protein
LVALLWTMFDGTKTLTFLDGGDGETGVLGMFRQERSAVLRELYPSREADSIRSSASVDGRYFARQLYLPMIEALMMALSTIDVVLPSELAERVEECRRVMAVGGVEEVKRVVEAAAEADGNLARIVAVQEKERELLKKNDGADLSPKQQKKVRNSGSSSKSNQKRKTLYDLTRARLEALLVLREDINGVFYRLLESKKGYIDAGNQILLPRPA